MKSVCFALCLLCFALSLPGDPAAAAKHTAQTPPPVGNSLAGVKIGMDKDDAHAVLTALGGSNGSKDTDDDKKADAKGADPDSVLPEVWVLKTTPYERIVFAVDDDDKVRWVTGFARPGQNVPFASLGSLSRAAASGPAFAVWNVISPLGSYRKIARGRNGQAMSVSLLPLKSANPNGVFSPQIIPKITSKGAASKPK